MGRVCARSQHQRQDGPLLERLALLCVRSSVRYRTVVNPNLNKYCCMMDNTNVSDEATSPVPTLIPMPVDIRSLALSVLAVIATVFAMAWTKAIVVPLLMGLMVSYALTPVVNRLARWHVPRVVGAALVMGAIVFAFAWGGWSLRDEAVSFVDSLPSLSHNLRQKLKFPRSTPVDTIAKVQQAATRNFEGRTRKRCTWGADTASDGGTPCREHTGLSVERRSPGLIALLGQTAIVMLVAFFLLASGNNFRRKMVKLAGPKLSKKRITIKALDKVDRTDSALPAGANRNQRCAWVLDLDGLSLVWHAQRWSVGRGGRHHQPDPLFWRCNHCGGFYRNGAGAIRYSQPSADGGLQYTGHPFRCGWFAQSRA